mmetsp:Transcript_10592/g.20087  ORF Transcript_10592/g.20087 Transcript_10592/m.20087 type:complete len:225 (-) Transcript_10592:228-902(-)
MFKLEPPVPRPVSELIAVAILSALSLSSLSSARKTSSTLMLTSSRSCTISSILASTSRVWFCELRVIFNHAAMLRESPDASCSADTACVALGLRLPLRNKVLLSSCSAKSSICSILVTASCIDSAASFRYALCLCAPRCASAKVAMSSTLACRCCLTACIDCDALAVASSPSAASPEGGASSTLSSAGSSQLATGQVAFRRCTSEDRLVISRALDASCSCIRFV